MNYFKNPLKFALCLTAAVLLVYVLFRPAFSSYFFQDDWFVFSLVLNKKVRDLFSFFTPVKNVIWYSPLGVQLPFYLVHSVFGLNPIPFKIAVFIFHLLNTYLIYKLLSQFLKNNHLVLFGSFFYLTSSAHQLLFYWAATISFILTPFFYFTSLLLAIYDRRKLSLVIFTLGLLTNEIMITFPLILIFYRWLFKKNFRYKEYVPYWLFSGLYFVFRLTFSSSITSYPLITDLKKPIRNIFF